MSVECSECEHDLRGGHGPECSRRTNAYEALQETQIRHFQNEGLVIFNVPVFSNVVTVDVDLTKGGGFKLPPEPILDRVFVDGIFVTKSKSGVNLHYFLKLNTPLHRTQLSQIAIAAGSDLRRELLSLMRHEKGEEHAWCVFETKDEAARLREWVTGTEGFAPPRNPTSGFDLHDGWMGNGLVEIPELPLPVAKRPLIETVFEKEEPF